VVYPCRHVGRAQPWNHVHFDAAQFRANASNHCTTSTSMSPPDLLRKLRTIGIHTQESGHPLAVTSLGLETPSQPDSGALKSLDADASALRIMRGPRRDLAELAEVLPLSAFFCHDRYEARMLLDIHLWFAREWLYGASNTSWPHPVSTNAALPNTALSVPSAVRPNDLQNFV
jgi:hypothetical protein